MADTRSKKPLRAQDAPLRFSRTPAELIIDGRVVQFDVTPFDVATAADFWQRWVAAHERPSQVVTSKRLPGEEMAKRSVTRARTPAEIAAAAVLAELRADASWPDSPGKNRKLAVIEALVPAVTEEQVFEISPAEIRARRLAAMTLEEHDAQMAREADERARLAEFTYDAIVTYVRARPGQIFLGDREITSGEDLAALFAGRPEVIEQLKHLPLNENFLIAAPAEETSEARVQTATEGSEKNGSRSLSGIDGSSDSDRQASQTTAGSAPEPTAAFAAPTANADAAPAMA